jgi:hypothetical protein
MDSLSPDWQRQVENVRDAAMRLWDRPAPRHAVDHGPQHADRVVTLLDGLAAALTPSPLTGQVARQEHALEAEEIYILLAAAYLHAVGLQDEKAEPDQAARWARYPELGAELIFRSLEEPQPTGLGLVDDPGLVEMVALVVSGHRQTEHPAPDFDDFPLARYSGRG